jgi:hypothetical protein
MVLGGEISAWVDAYGRRLRRILFPPPEKVRGRAPIILYIINVYHLMSKAPHAPGTVYPQMRFFFFWSACITTARITNVPDSHSDKAPGGSLPGMRPVYTVNWSYTR